MRIRSLALAGAVAGTVVISAVALADIPDAGVFHACVQNKKDTNDERTLRLIDVSNGGSCRKDESAVSWNAIGPQGLPGPQGPPGAQGPVGPQGPAGSGGTVLCFGPGDGSVHIINAIMLATLPGSLTVR